MAKSKSSSKKVHKHSKEKKDAKPSKVKSWIDAHRLLTLCIVLVGGYILWNQVVLRVIEVQRLKNMEGKISALSDRLYVNYDVRSQIIKNCSRLSRKFDREPLLCSIRLEVDITDLDKGRINDFTKTEAMGVGREFVDGIRSSPSVSCAQYEYSVNSHTASLSRSTFLGIKCSQFSSHSYYPQQ